MEAEIEISMLDLLVLRRVVRHQRRRRRRHRYSPAQRRKAAVARKSHSESIPWYSSRRDYRHLRGIRILKLEAQPAISRLHQPNRSGHIS